MQKRLKQAFLETSILLGWFSSQLINEDEDGDFSDDLMDKMLYTEKKYNKMARRLGYPTRNEELNEIMKSIENSDIMLQ